MIGGDDGPTTAGPDRRRRMDLAVGRWLADHRDRSRGLPLALLDLK
ncbi:hypothetical protein ACH4TV_39045 [Streptomyces sp. NPDC020898]